MATATNTPAEENPRKTLASDPLPSATTEPSTENQLSSADIASPEKVAGSESKAATGDPTAVSSGSNDDAVTDTQKKIRRAERFGMPVQLSEEEKRNSRAERFGTRSGSQGSDAIKKSEDLKRKARAERFGIEQSVPTDEDEKKKARLARFTPASSTDSVEENKKKARALRFSESQTNGKGKIEPKTAIAGKAGGGD